MRINILLLLVLCCISAGAKTESEYSLDYPDSLTTKADAIINYSYTHYTLNKGGQLILKNEKVVTILNDRGDEFREFVVWYDKFSDVKSLNCVLLDEDNKVIRKLKKKDFNDISYYDGFTLFSDNRLKYWTAVNQQYPYVIKVNYEIEFDGFTAIPKWVPQDDYRLAVKQAKFTFDFQKDLNVRSKLMNKNRIQFSEKSDDDRTIYQWEVRNLMALTKESLSPSLTGQVPIVMLSPDQFEYDGYKGRSDSWKSIGAWNYSLLPHENELTAGTKQHLDQLIQKAADDRELTQLVYEFAQSRTRYVGIQLGIGGWKPFPSLTVDELGYGDCKALSFYIKTMLAYVGIESVYTVIGSGGLKIAYRDFPSKNQTNHVILCVPMPADTVWLECTSQTDPFNHLSSSCTNRLALLVKNEGGELVYIKQKNENIQSRESEISLSDNGDASIEYESNYVGDFFDRKKSLNQRSKKELSEYLMKNLPLSDIRLSSFSTSINSERPELILKASFTAKNLSSLAGNRLIVELSPFAKLSSYGKQKEERRNPVVFGRAKKYNDKVVFHIPEGFDVEHLPENKDDNSKYGNYHFDVQVEDGEVVVNRSFEIMKGRYPKEEYEAIIDYLNQVSENDKCKLVLKKKV